MQMPQGDLQLDDGSRVGVIGGGPAGSFFSIFLLDTAKRMGIDIEVDIYEPRDYTRPGPVGCNMCGGIISESLVQNLAAEGINLPPTVIQRGIDSYMLHMDVGSVRIETPLQEKRIGAVYRGPGPRDIKEIKWGSFDAFLQHLSIENGAKVINKRVDEIVWQDEYPQIKIRNQSPQSYDLVTIAVGVNSASRKLFANLNFEYEAPKTTKTFIQEYYLGEELIVEELGSSMHVFLLDIPRLEFAAIIPKGDYVSVCLLGEDIDKELVGNFMNSPEVRGCFPSGWDFDAKSCNCSPRINIAGAGHPYGDRIVFIGDSGVTRLYKDGIGAAYRTAKSAATTAVLQGISAEDFKEYYLPACRKIETDNLIGQAMFIVTRLIQKFRFARRAVFRMTVREQKQEGSKRRMSMVLWDMFTGSAPYKEIFVRTLNPAFLSRFVSDLAVSITGRQ
jgi:flavin-dependent dehydrogenase